MSFDPKNHVVKLCLQGMAMEEKDNAEEANRLFLQAWAEATFDIEKFISAHFLARVQSDAAERLKWLQTALKFALKIDDGAVKSAFPPLYLGIAKCYEAAQDSQRAKENYELARSFDDTPSDKGPFYHGTKADLRIGDFLEAGKASNYKPELRMNHVYFTALVNGAGLAAELANGEKTARVYLVEPTGPLENDPNVTNKKFPGNPTRSYRSQAPLRIVGEVTDWVRLSSGDLKKWREKIALIKGEIIN